MNRTTVGRPMEILLVEDDLEDARMTIEALAPRNVHCRVSLVRDGEEAMRFLHQEGIFGRVPHPDLVLLDMELPKKNGREVLAELRADPELKQIPVVILTASLVHKSILQAQELRVDGYMTKPVDLEQFIVVVKALRRCWLSEAILPAMS